MLGATHSPVYICISCIRTAEDILVEEEGLRPPQELPAPHLLRVTSLRERSGQHRPRSAAAPGRCSFCEATAGERQKVIAGPGVNLCDECAFVGAEVLALVG